MVDHNGEKSVTEKMMREVDEKLSIKELGPNIEKMMITPYHQHSYLSSSIPVSQLMHSCHALSLYYSHALHCISLYICIRVSYRILGWGLYVPT